MRILAVSRRATSGRARPARPRHVASRDACLACPRDACGAAPCRSLEATP